MSQLPLNSTGVGSLSVQPLPSQTAKIPVEPNKESYVTQPVTPPQEAVSRLSKPVEEASRSESLDLKAGRTEITSQMVELRLSTAAEELSHARAQAARITGEMEAEGLIPSAAARTDAVTREKAENAFAQTREIDATADNATTSRIV